MYYITESLVGVLILDVHTCTCTSLGLLYNIDISSLAHTVVLLNVIYCRNYAIADYLQSQGYGETLDSFRKELDTVSLSTTIVMVALSAAL